MRALVSKPRVNRIARVCLIQKSGIDDYLEKSHGQLLLEQAIDLGGLRPGIRDRFRNRGRFGHGVQMML